MRKPTGQYQDMLCRFPRGAAKNLPHHPHRRHEHVGWIGEKRRLVPLDQMPQPRQRKGERNQQQAYDPVVPHHDQRRKSHRDGNHVQGAVHGMIVRAIVMRVESHSHPHSVVPDYTPAFLPTQSLLIPSVSPVSRETELRSGSESATESKACETWLSRERCQPRSRKKTTASPLPGGLPQKPLEHLVRQQPSTRSKSRKPALPRHEARGHHLIHDRCCRLQTAELFGDGLQVDPAGQP